jgi:hypothetical protein
MSMLIIGRYSMQFPCIQKLRFRGKTDLIDEQTKLFVIFRYFCETACEIAQRAIKLTRGSRDELINQFAGKQRLGRCLRYLRRLVFDFECTRSENQDLHIHARDRRLVLAEGVVCVLLRRGAWEEGSEKYLYIYCIYK